MHANLTFTDYISFLNKTIKKRTASLLSQFSFTPGSPRSAEKFEMKRNSGHEKGKGIAFHCFHNQ